MPERIKWSLIGIGDHQGVINVGGRIGAAKGPVAFRRVFSRLRGRDFVHESSIDRGDLTPILNDVEKNHQNALSFVRDAHPTSSFSVVVGGGHDHGFTHLAGVYQALSADDPKLRMGCINIDAHLDVRAPAPKIGSGSPFYLALESGLLKPEHFVEFGTQSHCNSPELWKYIEDRRRVRVVPFEVLRHGNAAAHFQRCLRKLSSKCDAVVISLDLDAVASADAPGVSAPQAEGFSATDVIEMMEISGRDRKVVSLGIFELNPEHDLDDRTARLAATAGYHFVAAALIR